MPLVKIDVFKNNSEDYKKTMLEIVRNSLVETLEIKDDSIIQRLYEIDRNFYDVPNNKSSNFTIVEITFFPGRSNDLKKSLINKICNGLKRELNIDSSDIYVVIQEPPLDNWGMYGEQVSSIDK